MDLLPEPRFTREETLFSHLRCRRTRLRDRGGVRSADAKVEGFDVETVDHADQQTLFGKYADVPNVDFSRIARDNAAFFRSREDARAAFENCRQTQDFVDIQGWQFTPSGLRLIAEDLHLMGCICIQLREERCLLGDGEFFFSLSKRGGGPDLPRIDLASQTMQEQHAICFT